MDRTFHLYLYSFGDTPIGANACTAVHSSSEWAEFTEGIIGAGQPISRFTC